MRLDPPIQNCSMRSGLVTSATGNSAWLFTPSPSSSRCRTYRPLPPSSSMCIVRERFTLPPSLVKTSVTATNEGHYTCYYVWVLKLPYLLSKNMGLFSSPTFLLPFSTALSWSLRKKEGLELLGGRRRRQWERREKRSLLFFFLFSYSSLLSFIWHSCMHVCAMPCGIISAGLNAMFGSWIRSKGWIFALYF